MTTSTRRHFLRRAGGALAGALSAPYIITSAALGQGDVPPAGERVTLGHIGVGGRGSGLLGGFLNTPGARSVAVCDPFISKREGAAKAVDDHYGDPGGCTAYNDFRELLARDDIDAVVVATHDGWHVPAAIAAVRAGKDIYVEKPLGVSVAQNIALREACQRYGAVFQYGTQQRSQPHCRHGSELIRNGYIGEVLSIEVEAPAGSGGGSTEPIPVPDDLDYDMWLGPAPMTPYTADRCSTLASYFVYDNSIGYLGGWGAHPLDILDWAWGSDEMMPVEYEGTGVIPTEGLYNSVTTWEVSCVYPNGVPLAFRSSGRDLTRFVGTEGWLNISRGGNDADPKSLLTQPLTAADDRLPASFDHHRDFIDAIRERRPAVSYIESAVRSDTISHLSDIAIRTGRKIAWDPAAEDIIDDDTARRMLVRPMRPPWRL